MERCLFHQAEVRFARRPLANLEGELRSQLEAGAALFRGKRSIALAVGSRGITDIFRVVRGTVQFLREIGTEPFIIPAMGSHGGATAAGQAALLESYGITAAAVGCPIRSSMEVVPLAAPGLETALWMDREAFEADGVILINRIKPHTDFHGRYESGLVKMAVIGLGKERQALEMHRFGTRGLRDLVPLAAERVLASGKIVAGLGLVEDSYDQTARVELIPARAILEREPALLEMARGQMPRLPVEQLDVLIVDELGKNISGTGLDTNIIGRVRIATESEPASPQIKMVLVDDLTEESHGNATGMGLADLVTERFRRKIDFGVTYRNIVTSGFLERGKLPVVVPHAREGLAVALRSCGVFDPARARIIRIRNTLDLGTVFVSAALRAELAGRADVRIEPAPTDLLDAAGDLAPWPSADHSGT